MLKGKAESLSPSPTGPPCWPRWTWWALVPLALAGAATAIPYLWWHGVAGTAVALQQAFSLVCHQRPERSFWLFGGTVAVCSRCLGIYVGAALGLLLRTARKLALQCLVAAVVLNAIESLSEIMGLHGNWLDVRFLLGLMLGAAAALLVSSSLPAAGSEMADLL